MPRKFCGSCKAAHTSISPCSTVRLSGSDSTGVAALLTAHASPFIFLTGMRPDDVRSFPRAPVVEKPYKVETLIEALRKALGGH